MVNNFFAIVGLMSLLLGMYLWIYEICDIRVSIIFYLIGAGLVMFEFVNANKKNEVE